MCEASDGFVPGIQAADFGAAAGEFRFPIAVEVIGVGAIGLEFPGDAGVGQKAGEENLTGFCPRGHVGAAAATHRRAVGGTEPVWLTASQDFEFGAVGTGDADVGGFVAGIVLKEAVLEEEPFAIGRPGGAEVEMIGMGGDEFAGSPFGVAGPDLVTLRAGDMEGDALVVRADAETVGQSFAEFCEGAGIGAVEFHAEDLADFAARHLHKHAVVADESLWGVEDFVAVFCGDFRERLAVQIVKPEMGGCEGVILVEGTAGTVAALFHTEEDDAAAIRKKRTGLPGDLVRDIELERFEPGAIGANEAGLSGGGEEEPLGFGVCAGEVRATYGSGGEGG